MIDFFNDAITFYEQKTVPYLRVFAVKYNLYYISFGIFLFAVFIGAVALFLRVCFKKTRKKSPRGVLAFFALCFFADVAVCLCELNFSGKYFKTLAEAYCFCFLKFCVLGLLYIIIAAENSLLLSLDKNEEKKSDLKRSEYIKICEQPEEYNSSAIKFLKCAEKDKKNDARFPDLNISYVLSLCERLKKQPLSETDREFINDLIFSLKTGDFSTEKQAKKLNENLRKLIKKAAEEGVPA